jgi:hypothetical protein
MRTRGYSATPAQLATYRHGCADEVTRQDSAEPLIMHNVVMRRDRVHSKPLRTSFAYC